MSNSFYHMQLNTPNPDRAKAFYGALFGWPMNDVPMPHGTYTMVAAGDGPGGGIAAGGPEVPSHWLTYVSVSDVASATGRARELGATVIQDVTEVPGMGAFSILTDPTGASFGLWQEG